MPTPETDAWASRRPGVEGWSMLDLASLLGDATLLLDAIAFFDEALTCGLAEDHAHWHYGRGLARGVLADQSGDPAGWRDALADLWAAWDALPHPDVSRTRLTDDLARALINQRFTEPEDDPVALDRLNDDFDRLAPSDLPSVSVGRGLARLQRYRRSRVDSDHDEGVALLRVALPAAPDDLPALGPALSLFAVVAAADGEFADALAAVERLGDLLGPGHQDSDLQAFEADLLYTQATESDSVAVQDDALARLERLCAAADPPPPTGLLSCGELRLLRTSTGASGDDPGSDLDAAVRWLERAVHVVEGDDLAHGHLKLGMAHNRRAKLIADATEHEHAIESLDAALALGLSQPDLTLSAHQERVLAYNAIRDEDAIITPAGMAEAFTAGLAALGAHPDADLRCRAELALELVAVDMALSSLRMDLPDIPRIQRHIDLAAAHPAPPRGWATALAVARASVQGVIDVIGGGSGDAGVSFLAEALNAKGHSDVIGETLRRLIGYQSVIVHGRTGALHAVESAARVFQSPAGGPTERFLAVLSEFVLSQQQSGDRAQSLAKIDAAIAAAAEVDPQTWSGRMVGETFLPLLHAVRKVGRADASPLPDLPALATPGSHSRQARAAVEIMRAAAAIATAPPDQPWARRDLDALEQQVAQLPPGGIRGVGVGTLLVLWRHRAERLPDAASAERALAWADEALAFASGPEHPFYAATAEEASRAHRIRGLADDLRRSRELRLRALRGQAWMVLLQSGTAHALGRAHKAAADAVELARWCHADLALDDLVSALDAGRGLVLQAAIATRGVTEQLTAAGAADLAAEWTAAGGDDTVALPATVDLGLHSDLRGRVLRALTAAGAEIAEPVSVDAIRAALRARAADALVYLVPADPAGPGLAVVVPTLAPVEVIELPALDATEAATLARSTTGTAGRELLPPGAPIAPAVPAAPATLMDWAWRVAGVELASLADRLRPAAERRPRLVLVPFGPLALVPWHAARPDDPAGLGLLERAVVSYIPSAYLLGQAVARVPVADGASLIVGNPTGDLPEAGAEAQALVKAFHPEAVYLGCSAAVDGPAPSGSGTAPEVVAVLSSGARPLALLHLACHAQAHPTEPWRSSLQLADRGVDVNELLGVSHSRRLDVDTVFLAGCSTNVAGAAHDEAFSLATAFLAAGARTAYGSMWTVPDEHTSRLMFMVHHYRTHEGCDPDEALHRAQHWAADPDRMPPPTMPAALARGAVAAVDVLSWAAFQHVGA